MESVLLLVVVVVVTIFGSAFLANAQSYGVRQGAIFFQKMGVSRGKLFPKNGCIKGGIFFKK